MGVYLYPNNTETELKNAYIGIPFPTSIVLDKSSISLTTIGQTEQLTATIEPTLSDQSVTWSSDDTTVATVSTSGLVTCVTPGTCTITATTVNGLTATCSVRQSRLPVAYQEVEYIESSGTQYIDTGWTPSSNYCKVVTSMDFEGGAYNVVVFFGMGVSSKFYSLHINPNWQINAGSTGNINIGTYSNGKLDVEYLVNNNSYSLTLGGNTYTGSYSNTIAQSTRPMYIFVFNENGSKTWWAYAKLYSFKIYSDSSTLERDFVPCYRIADAVIGLYDIANDQFYTNSGTGTFTKGPDV